MDFSVIKVCLSLILFYVLSPDFISVKSKACVSICPYVYAAQWISETLIVYEMGGNPPKMMQVAINANRNGTDVPLVSACASHNRTLQLCCTVPSVYHTCTVPCSLCLSSTIDRKCPSTKDALGALCDPSMQLCFALTRADNAA